MKSWQGQDYKVNFIFGIKENKEQKIKLNFKRIFEHAGQTLSWCRNCG